MANADIRIAPMLAYQKYPDITKLKYPLLGSTKLDGLRALVKGGQLVSRTLKPIPNRYAQKLFAGLPEGTDGELIVGDPTDDPFRRTDSAMMREDGEPDVRYYVFDNFMAPGAFVSRFAVVGELWNRTRVKIIEQQIIENPERLKAFELECLDAGYEGGILRSFEGPYKYGRSTLNEGYLLKLKRYEDSDAEVLGTYERLHNGNEATTDNLGHTARSSHKANKTGQGTLGGFFVRDVHSGVEFKVPSSAIKEGERKKLWKVRDSLVGKFLKYKFFPTGMKDRPRHPVFLAWRSKEDIS